MGNVTIAANHIRSPTLDAVNMITQAEAQRHWCPFSRHGRDRSDHDAKCITTRCMAWRRSAADPEVGCCGLARALAQPIEDTASA